MLATLRRSRRSARHCNSSSRKRRGRRRRGSDRRSGWHDNFSQGKGGGGKRSSQDQAKTKAKINTKITEMGSKQPDSPRNKRNRCKQWQLIVVERLPIKEGEVT
jgi:hypothetical protein